MTEKYRERLFNNYVSAFQNVPGIYDKSKIERWGKSYRYYLRNWLPKSSEAAIAEVACGSGRLLRLLNTLGYKNLYAVDISPEQVMLAKQVCPNVEEANILEWLRKYPQTFDCIVGIDIIEHFNKVEVTQFLDGCFAALKPGGRIILQTPNTDSMFGSSTRYYDFTHEVGFGFRALSSLLITTGFANTEGREVGPIPYGHGIKSSIRNIIWQFIRLLIKIWNYAEIGHAGEKIFTRNMLITAEKSDKE
jgi:2-polyprenyl-3-methyl-5-hydroxy-6-metoxy-1,4-benzoquinol methylase